ncbi:hypothetical protein AGMMS49992_27210 [Clostridia bacterium]|nr:hypothetical protein AGMMS49992_27210 [Clostridia bacterium]
MLDDNPLVVPFPVVPRFEYMLEELAKILKSIMKRDSDPPRAELEAFCAAFAGMIKYELIRNGSMASSHDTEPVDLLDKLKTSMDSVVYSICEELLHSAPEIEHKVLAFKQPD